MEVCKSCSSCCSSILNTGTDELPRKKNTNRWRSVRVVVVVVVLVVVVAVVFVVFVVVDVVIL